MKQTKRILSVILCLAMLAAVVSMGVIEGSAAYSMTWDDYYGKVQSFIGDSRWSNGTSWGGSQGPKLSSWSSSGCCAYAADFTKYVFGAPSQRSGDEFYSAADIRAGDVLYLSPEHWVAVLTRSNNILYTAEGNCAGRVRVTNEVYRVNGNNFSGSEKSFVCGYHYLNVTNNSNTPTIDSCYIDYNLSNQNTFRPNCIVDPSAVAIDHVSVAVWSEGSQSDLRWYDCLQGGAYGTIYYYDVPFSNHDSGARSFICDFYVFGINGKTSTSRVVYGYYGFDVNGYLDGVHSYNTGDYGTYDVYINNQQEARNVNDYAAFLYRGTTYEIKNIKAKPGYTYNGIYSGKLSGTMMEDASIVLSFSTNSSTLKINPNGGMWNGSGAVQSFTQKYNTTKSIPVPTRNGYTFTGWTRNGTYGNLSSTTTAATYTYGATNSVTDTITATWSCNHANTTTVTATASTCTVKGYSAGVYCNDCKKYISGHQEQPLAAHTITVINKRDATYDAEGYTGDEYCTVCKQTIHTGTAIPKLDRPTQPDAPTPENVCPWCGGQHVGFFQGIIGFFHRIFASLFGARY